MCSTLSGSASWPKLHLLRNRDKYQMLAIFHNTLKSPSCDALVVILKTCGSESVVHRQIILAIKHLVFSIVLEIFYNKMLSLVIHAGYECKYIVEQIYNSCYATYESWRGKLTWVFDSCELKIFFLNFQRIRIILLRYSVVLLFVCT